MGFTEGRIAVDHENGVYYPGQTVFGKVIFDQGKVKTFRGIYVVIKGFCKVHWTSTHSRRVNDRTETYTKVHESYEEYFEKKIYLIGGKSGEASLAAGHYELPFECALPGNLPSSYEGSVGHIRYRVKAVVDRAFKFDQELYFTLRILSPIDLNTIANAKNRMEFEMENTYCCWCVSSGSSEVLVKVPMTGFCVGQTIPVEISCANNSSVEIDRIRMKISRDTIFHAISEPDTKKEHDKLAELAKGPVPPNTTRNWTLEMEVPEMTVYNLNSCRFIDIDHYFKVDIETSGCHEDTDQTRKIYFGNVPLQGTKVDDDAGFINPVTNVQNIPGVTSPFPTAVTNQPMPYPGVTNYPPHGNQPLPNVSPYPSQYPSNTPYPGGNPPNPGAYPPPYPGSNSPYPGSNPPYPGSNPTYPGSNPPYPGSNPPYPGSNPPYTGSNLPYPDSSPPYPGPNPPVVGPTPSVTVPMLPPGAGVLIGRPNPFSTASAPEPPTPN